MPEGDAQKKEADQARSLENLTLEEDAANGGAQAPGGGALTDAQKKELE